MKQTKQLEESDKGRNGWNPKMIGGLCDEKSSIKQIEPDYQDGAVRYEKGMAHSRKLVV